MTERIKVAELAPEAYRHMFALEKWMAASPLPKTIRELVKLRVSQINGCGFCVDMHAHDLRAMGEPDERMFSLVTWRDAPFYTEQERAALRLAEEATYLDREGVSDETWAEARTCFDEQTLVALVVTIATINAWNRYGVISRRVPGSLRANQTAR